MPQQPSTAHPHNPGADSVLKSVIQREPSSKGQSSQNALVAHQSQPLSHTADPGSSASVSSSATASLPTSVSLSITISATPSASASSASPAATAHLDASVFPDPSPIAPTCAIKNKFNLAHISTNSPSLLANSTFKSARSSKPRSKKSVAFFVLLDTDTTTSSTTPATATTPSMALPSPQFPTIISPSSPGFPAFHLHPAPAALLSPTTLGSRLTLRITRAHFKRLALLHARRTRLRRHGDEVEYRVLLNRQRERVHVLKVRAKVEYKSVVAELNRKVHVARVIERCKSNSNFKRPGGMIGAGSLDDLGTWSEEDDNSVSEQLDLESDYYGGEDSSLPSPSKLRYASDKDAKSEGGSSGLGPSLSDVMNALKLNSAAYFDEQDAQGLSPNSSDLNSSENDADQDSMTAYDKDLLAEFESSFGASRDAAAKTNLRINDLFDMIKALSEGRDRVPPFSSVEDESEDSFDAVFPSPVQRSLVSNGKLVELFGLNEAIAGISGGTTTAGRRKSSVAMSPTAKLLRRRDLLDEPLSEIVERNKSLPVQILDELDENDYMELIPLLPPVTRFTLRELDMDEILLNPQLRHDLYFDPNLQFKPNMDGERNHQKKVKASLYWSNLGQEIDNKETYRIPLIVYEIKCILKELLPYSQATHQEIEASIDVVYIAQQLEHGVFDAVSLIRYLCNLLKTNCAPARDERLEAMLAQCEAGKLCESLAICFEVLELMKLDYANHQLQRIRPHVVEHAVEFESNWFKDEIRWKRASTKLSEIWFKTAYQQMISPTIPALNDPSSSSEPPKPTPPMLYQFAKPTLTHVYTHAVLDLIQNSPALTDDPDSATDLPEVLSMDVSRLSTFRNDVQDIIILSSLLMLYRQIAGPKSNVGAHMKTMKENLWVLLNDSDTSLSHIVSEMVRGAGTVRGNPISAGEAKVLDGLVEKTLAPESKVFLMVASRVLDLLFGWLVNVLDGAGNVVHSVASGTTASSLAESSESDSGDSSEDEAPVQAKGVAARASTNSMSTSSLPAGTVAVSRAVAIDRVKLGKYGLLELEEEIRDLAGRMGTFAKLNKAVYFDVFTSFYEEGRGLK
ncbi:T-complex protein 11-domain-containing protein [Chytriomyces cf. hyalinus JEL632]|nr:T-complex protein 11-domain-containing protein [Chytriomyces cf. hyalinus JEL632]